MKEHSRKQSQRIADYIKDNPVRFEELIRLFLNGSYRVTQRAAWILSICSENCPHLLGPHLEHIILNLDKPVHDAVKRNTIRLLQYIAVPVELEGRLAGICFRFLSSGSEPIAVKVFSMTVLANLCKKEPDLASELKLLIESQLPVSGPAFHSRAAKVLKELRKLHKA